MRSGQRHGRYDAQRSTTVCRPPPRYRSQPAGWFAQLPPERNTFLPTWPPRHAYLAIHGVHHRAPAHIACTLVAKANAPAYHAARQSNGHAAGAPAFRTLSTAIWYIQGMCMSTANVLISMPFFANSLLSTNCGVNTSASAMSLSFACRLYVWQTRFQASLEPADLQCKETAAWAPGGYMGGAAMEA
eukprot:364721-Chlamydomonas_euryale.AAC.10